MDNGISVMKMMRVKLKKGGTDVGTSRKLVGKHLRTLRAFCEIFPAFIYLFIPSHFCIPYPRNYTAQPIF